MFANRKLQAQIATIQKQLTTGKVKNEFAAKQKIKNLQVKEMAELRKNTWEQHLAR